jgi:hypothetical protein
MIGRRCLDLHATVLVRSALSSRPRLAAAISCPVDRCGRRELGGGRRLLAVDPEGSTVGGG